MAEPINRDIETESVPREALISHVLAHANESDDWDATFPEQWHDAWNSFSLHEDTHSYNVDILDDVTIVVSGDIDTTFARQVRSATYAPNSKAHPAEYENVDVAGIFSVEMVLEDLGWVTDVTVEAWVA